MENQDEERELTVSPTASRPPWDLRQGAAAVICGAAVIFALWLVFRYALGIALPFLLAWLLSRMVKPLAGRLSGRTRLPRGLWAAVLVLLTVGGFVTLAISGIRRGLGELSTLAEELAADTDGLVAAIEGALERARSLSFATLRTPRATRISAPAWTAW